MKKCQKDILIIVFTNFMAHRIEVASKIPDTRAAVRKKEIESAGFSGKINTVKLADVYTVDTDLNPEALQKVASMLANPVFQEPNLNRSLSLRTFDYAVEIGFLPGVTDNVGNTVRESLENVLGKKLDGQTVHSSQLMFLSGDLSREEVQKIGETVANPLIQRIHVKSYEEFDEAGGMDVIVPRVNLNEKPRASLVNILGASDEELVMIGKKGIANPDGTRRGPLALDITYMTAIKDYFSKERRNPTDVEVEYIAQGWSEHCEHTIFGDPIDDIPEGLFKRYIRGATEEILRRKAARGEENDCVSLFTDNAGAIIFDDKWLITDKKETHNSPSALDPFGGAITGIVGVNRDAIGFGMGAKPVINGYGFCFADPRDNSKYFRDEEKKQPLLSSRRIMDGVISGVNSGGNQSGIPTPQGFVYFDERFRGKPLVFVRTLGLIPREVNGKPSHEKKAQPGDYIVMIGGRVGKDGIHGATFSSEALSSGSPATAVQIGDPITQKKLSDALVKEARDLGLYTSNTDNGAGGLSCSVHEMATESGGCILYLDKVPTKYPGLRPDEIGISESQERMTLSVPKDKWNQLNDLMKRRGVEASIIGEFTNTGRAVSTYHGETVADLDLDFLHNGRPARPMKTTFTPQKHEEPTFDCLDDLTKSLHDMLMRPNIASFEFISKQYDHEVQAGSVIKPLQGRGLVNGDATVVRPVLDSQKAVAISQGINPSYSDIDTYNMAACAIDTAVRNLVAAGANPRKIKLMDNYCWCSSNDPERLGQLKRAVIAGYDVSVAYETPFISGKDSMFNDFKGFDGHGNPVKISIPPTLDISSVAVMDDATKSISLDAKCSGDIIYLLGETDDELGGSEYFAMVGEQTIGKRYVGNKAPKVNTDTNLSVYQKFYAAAQKGLVSSAKGVDRGGLAVALAKTAMAGRLGIEININDVTTYATREDYTIYSESQGRLLVTVDPERAEEFERVMDGTIKSRIGTVRADDQFLIRGLDGRNLVNTTVPQLLNSYKSTFKDY